MTKLTKEEYIEALGNYDESFDRFIDNSGKNLAIIEDLIDEHFELLKKYDDVCDKFHDDHFELEDLKREYKLLEWELKQKDKELEKKIKDYDELQDIANGYLKKVIELDKALNKACELLSSRDIPYEEKIENGFTTYANYFNSKEWKTYLMNEVKENGKELGEWMQKNIFNVLDH